MHGREAFAILLSLLSSVVVLLLLVTPKRSLLLLATAIQSMPRQRRWPSLPLPLLSLAFVCDGKQQQDLLHVARTRRQLQPLLRLQRESVLCPSFATIRHTIEELP